MAHGNVSPAAAEHAMMALVEAHRRDLDTVAREVLEERTADPAGRDRVALLAPLGLYCAARGLYLAPSQARCGHVPVVTGWSVAELAEQLAAVEPGLRAWALLLPHAARIAAPDEMLVAVVVDPQHGVDVFLKAAPLGRPA